MTFRVWLVQVNVQSFQEDCLHHPQMILAQLELHLPKLASVKSESTVQKLKVRVNSALSFMHEFMCLL